MNKWKHVKGYEGYRRDSKTRWHRITATWTDAQGRTYCADCDWPVVQR